MWKVTLSTLPRSGNKETTGQIMNVLTLSNAKIGAGNGKSWAGEMIVSNSARDKYNLVSLGNY